MLTLIGHINVRTDIVDVWEEGPNEKLNNEKCSFQTFPHII
jgi:hypothetical protein